MATLRERQKEHTRVRLTDCALSLFSAKGYPGTTVDDIAAAAGATRATFYLHFSSKAEVVKALLDRADALRADDDDAAAAADVVASGRRDLVEQHLSRTLDRWPTLRPYLAAAAQAAPSEPFIAAILDGWSDGAATALQEGLDRADRFPADSRRVRAVLAAGQLDLLSRRVLDADWPVPREVCLQTLTDSWCALLIDEQRAPATHGASTPQSSRKPER